MKDNLARELGWPKALFRFLTISATKSLRPNAGTLGSSLQVATTLQLIAPTMLLDPSPPAQLLAIVSVQPEGRVLCAQPNCGHSVFARIHVVQEGEKLLVLGSTCFGNRYGGAAALGEPRHGGIGGRPLTDAERELLASNTVALLAQFEQEHAAAQTAELAAKAALQAEREALHQATLEKRRLLAAPVPARCEPPAPALPRTTALPWPWMKRLTSLAYFELKDGTNWMRVTHADGSELLVPWPTFDAWDESLPSHIGIPHASIEALVLSDLKSAVAYLRLRTNWEKVTGLWRDMAAELDKRRSDKGK